MINIYNPDTSKYKKSAISAIESGWISNHGEFVNKSTDNLKKILNVKHAILMSNGTCATHCLFLSLKYKYPYINKIYVPNNCYVAAWNSVLMEYDKNSIEVMKMDINTWNICVDEDYIKSLDTNSAVLIVHNLGNIINVPRLKQIRPDLIFIEDNCEGFTGKYEGIYSGTSESTLCSSISFYGNKIITTGEGGAFLTNDEDVYNYILKAYSQGMSETRYLHDTHAYNFRMTNIQAAFLIDQLNDFDSIIKIKKQIFKNYKQLFDPLIKSNLVQIFLEESNTECANWIFAVRLVNNNKSISETMEYFKKMNIDIRPFFYPINSHEHLKEISFEDENSFILNKEIIMIPSSPSLTFETQQYIVSVIREFINEHNFYVRNCLICDPFQNTRKDFIYKEDNYIYKFLREHISNFIIETIKNYDKKLILEIGPLVKANELLSKNNIVETMDIYESPYITYNVDITKDNNIEKNRFDVIYCLDVIEHTYEPEECIKQMNLLLKTGGILHLSVPFQFRLHGPIPDCYRISEFGLRYLLEKHNFKISYFGALTNKERPAFPIHYCITCIKL
jgi:perosamine synthetase